MGAPLATRTTQDLGLVRQMDSHSHILCGCNTLSCIYVKYQFFAFRGPDNASLSWQKPESDGGKAISHYQLEVRENKIQDDCETVPTVKYIFVTGPGEQDDRLCEGESLHHCGSPGEQGWTDLG